MSDTTCKSDTCTCLDRYGFTSQNATDSGGAGSVVSTSAGESNPNCPTGYVWGGLGCVKTASSGVQPCSTGYAWDGTECILNDDDFECAEGYQDSGDGCESCGFDPVISCIAMESFGMMGANLTWSGTVERVDWELRIRDTESEIVASHVCGTVGGPALTDCFYTEDIADLAASLDFSYGTEICLTAKASSSTCVEYSKAVCFLYYEPASYPTQIHGTGFPVTCENID